LRRCKLTRKRKMPSNNVSTQKNPYGLNEDAHGAGRVAIRRALILVIVFMLVEFFGGLLANSLALISDALHMLTDSAALMLALFAFWIAGRPSTLQMSFGYHRAEILGALTSGLLIWFLTAMLVYEAILRFRVPQEVKGGLLFVIATLGLVVNLVTAWILYSARSGSLNLRAAYLHVLGDLLGSLGAILAGLVIWMTGWSLIDPLVTFLIAGLLLYGSWKIVAEAVGVLMESTPKGIDPEEVKKALEGLDVVQEVHDFHIWTVSSGILALSTHLVSTHPAEALAEANHTLDTKYGINHTTIQVEHPEKFQSDHCYDCTPK
jgi:cobalt-zinc-cadmium efflux system protein